MFRCDWWRADLPMWLRACDWTIPPPIFMVGWLFCRALCRIRHQVTNYFFELLLSRFLWENPKTQKFDILGNIPLLAAKLFVFLVNCLVISLFLAFTISTTRAVTDTNSYCLQSVSMLEFFCFWEVQSFNYSSEGCYFVFNDFGVWWNKSDNSHFQWAFRWLSRKTYHACRLDIVRYH